MCLNFVIELLKIGRLLKYQAGRFGDRLSDHVEELNDVGASVKGLQNLDFSVDFLSTNGLQNLHDALLVVVDVAAFKDLRVFPSS